MTEAEARQAVVDSARTWLGTPYHHRSRVKGHGCDCAQLIIASYSDTGLFPYFEHDVYSRDWHLHRGEEKYLSQIEQYFTRLSDDDRPMKQRPKDVQFQPGDILMFRLGRTYSHSAIVTAWPYIIHASAPSIIVEEVNIRGSMMEMKPTLAFTFWSEQ